ncbi:MAG TPA: response regulator transcription factor [bacterium]|nr:response regulator transcription factor [bacterium]
MRLLVVEDDVTLGGVLRQGLTEENYTVDLAVDGEAADYLFALNNYDAVVLDIRLPKKDGYALCRDWRAAGSPVPILMLTANDALTQKVAGLDSGADDYLTKPFEFDELLARLRALVRRGTGQASPRLTAGDLTLDPAAHRVTRGGQTLELSALEFRLLHYLLSRPGEVVPRADILEHVWDMNYDGDSNVVDVYISYLRQKTEAGGRARLIHTVRGVGYQLLAKP